MDIATIKNSKEYRLTKLEVLSLYFETKQMNEILLQQLADANAGKCMVVPDKYKNPEPVKEEKLNILIEPCDNEPEPENAVEQDKIETLTLLYNHKTDDLKDAKAEIMDYKVEIKKLKENIAEQDKEIHYLLTNDNLDDFKEEVYKLGIFNRDEDFSLVDYVEQMKDREEVYNKYWDDMDCMEDRQVAWDKLSKIEKLHEDFYKLISKSI